jgi:fucose 4-O-acetylase-like acetyltransferase
MDSFVSQKFKFWSFVSMVLLVFVHGYNLTDRYLQPWTLPHESLTLTSFAEYLFANGLFRFRIPMLFIISGFLYSMHDHAPNKQRIKKRVHTLLVPYLIWSAFAIAATYAFELSPIGKKLIEQSHIMQIDNTRMLIHDYKWYEVIARWLFFPVAYQLWFIRVLFIYNLAYPLIRWCVTHSKARWVYFLIALLFWLSTGGLILIEGEGLLFFSLGVWIQKTNFTIEKPTRWLHPLSWGLAFVLFAVIKTWLAFKGEALIGNAVYPTVTLLHKIVIVSGLVSCWFGLDKLVRWVMGNDYFVWLTAFSFIIYALHAPWVAIAIDSALEFFHPQYGYRMITFILLPTIVISLCISIGAILRSATPKIYGILTGGRGLKTDLLNN